ncbi:hypothetical protein P5W98_27965 [Paraburkholderia sp. A1BS-2L]|uniref:hypothetical protein n=1 Tax=Paraburkholderia sp. A1BS-2L TaxID=3028373 RepID=UPI003DA7B560
MDTLIRTGVLTNYLKVAQQLGFKPQPLLRKLGLNSEMFADPECRIPASAAVTLLKVSAQMGVVAEIGALPGGLTFTCNARVDQDVNFASSCVDSRFFPREDAQGRTQGQRTQRGVPRQELAGLQRGLDRKRRCNHVD